MNTTSLIAEIIIVGLFSIPWIFPIINKVIDLSEIIENGNNTLLLILGIAFTYFVGMLINQFSDLLFKKNNDKYYKKYGGKEKIQAKRIELIINSESFADYINQRRSIVRIFRSNISNIGIFLLFYLFNLFNTRVLYTQDFSFILICILIIMLILTLYSYQKTLKGYIKCIACQI